MGRFMLTSCRLSLTLLRDALRASGSPGTRHGVFEGVLRRVSPSITACFVLEVAEVSCGPLGGVFLKDGVFGGEVRRVWGAITACFKMALGEA